MKSWNKNATVMFVVLALTFFTAGCRKKGAPSEQPPKESTAEFQKEEEATNQSKRPTINGKVVQDDIEASSVQIAYMSGTKVIGEIGFKLGPDLIPGQGEASGPVKVMIFREIAPQHAATAKKWGVKVGGAYLEKGQGQYEYICDVDLTLSDEELAKQFGVETK